MVLRKKRQGGSKKKINRGSSSIYFIFLAVAIIGGIFSIGNLKIKETPKDATVVNIALPNSEKEKDNLQLYTFGYTTIEPTKPPPPSSAPPPPPNAGKGPGGLCSLQDDDGKQVAPDCKCIDLSVVCKGGKAYDDKGNPFTLKKPVAKKGVEPIPGGNPCGTSIAPGEGRYCIAKPIIYLYPHVSTFVDVRVESTGKVVVSDPLYPQGGWKNILAYPDGSLLYKGERYPELFYETDIQDFTKPAKGIVIKKEALRIKLGEILDQSGFISSEKEAFLSFWIPRLQALKSPYIFFSTLEKSEKERLDKVIITPQPDTFIAFIAYFKPIATPEYDNSLQLPPKPQRRGFVSVEWGGILDN